MAALRAVTAVALTLTFGSARADAWGCEGHRAVVFIAERLLSAPTLAAVRAVLADAPIDPALQRGCDLVPDDPIADSATWADDVRQVDPSTAGWHFINVPRAATLTASNQSTFCPQGSCVVAAVDAQFHALTSSHDAAVKGRALRFLLHLIGDLHQPLHATTNGDRGGNCLPVTYRGKAPQPNANGDFSPNLHGVWDSSTIRTVMVQRHLADARALAANIVLHQQLPASVAPITPSIAVATTWSQRAHEVAQQVAYGRLPIPVGIEPAVPLSSCTDNNDVVHRMLAKHEMIGGVYEQASAAEILRQLRFAGIRLAGVLKAAFP